MYFSVPMCYFCSCFFFLIVEEFFYNKKLPFLLQSCFDIIPETKRVYNDTENGLDSFKTVLRQLCQPPNRYYCKIERHTESGRHKESLHSLKVEAVRFIFGCAF